MKFISDILYYARGKFLLYLLLIKIILTVYPSVYNNITRSFFDIYMKCNICIYIYIYLRIYTKNSFDLLTELIHFKEIDARYSSRTNRICFDNIANVQVLVIVFVIVIHSCNNVVATYQLSGDQSGCNCSIEIANLERY